LNQRLGVFKIETSSATISDSQYRTKVDPRYYRPYKIIEKFGPVAYKLELPSSSKCSSQYSIYFNSREQWETKKLTPSYLKS